jgi:acyl carrier protein
MAGAPTEDVMSATSAARQLLADALALAEKDLPNDARIGAIERWDSLAHARILLAIEERIGKPLAPEDAAAVESLDDIARLLSAHR